MRWNRGGKTTLCKALILREGYTEKKAVRVVNAVVDIMKKALVQGKNVEIEGLGTLTIWKRKQFRQIVTVPPGGKFKKTLVTMNKHKKTVILKKKTNL